MAKQIMSTPHLNLTVCPLCGSDADKYNISEANVRFLQERLTDMTLDETITLARITWNMALPGAKLPSETKVAIDELVRDIQEQVNATLAPIDMILRNVAPLIEKLENLIDKVPKDIRNEFAQTNKELTEGLREIQQIATKTPLEMLNETIRPIAGRLDELIQKLPDGIRKEFTELNAQLHDKLKDIQEIAQKANDPIQKQFKELSDMLNKLINKPTAQGQAGQRVLAECWQERFIRDIVEVKGGPGESDLIVIPYLEFNGEMYGQKIVVERKAGKQRYHGNHLQKAIKHARNEGSLYVMLVYDKQANLLETQKPIQVLTQDNIIVAVSDMETGSWRTAREAFEVFQSITKGITETESEVDFAEIQRTLEDMQVINEQIEKLRNYNNRAINNCEKVRESIMKLETAITKYQQRLKELLSPVKTPQISRV